MADATGEASAWLNIGNMIDLAIGTPEIGVVDFGMLHTVLHCLAQQLRVREKNVELRGSIATLPVDRTNPQTVAVSEFLFETDENAKTPEARIEKKVELALPAPDQQTILVVERIKKPDSTSHPAQPRPPSLSSRRKSHASRSPASHTTHDTHDAHDSPSTTHTVASSERLSLVTISKFNVLEEAVEDLKNRVYGSIPKNEDILEEVRSQTNMKAITDMWTSLNVSSRLEAVENGIAKLSSLVEDLISATPDLQKALEGQMRDEPQPGTDAIHQPEPTQYPETGPRPVDEHSGTVAQPLRRTVAQPTTQLEHSPVHPPPGLATKTDLEAIQVYLQRLRDDHERLVDDFYDAMADLKPDMERPPSKPMPQLQTTAPRRTETRGMPTDQIPQSLPESEQTRGTTGLSQSSPISFEDIINRLIEVERKLKACCDNVNKQDGVVKDHINSFQDQLGYLTQQVAVSAQELANNQMSPDVAKDLPGLLKLYQTVQEMKEELKLVHETALQLAAEKEDRQGRIYSLVEQIELLKTIKLDREDMLEAMADKADLRMLARKVSHDQFELACDDLSRGLDHALGKLNLQETLWQQALDDIQREIEMKLDKIELSPVKEFFNSKLKQLQENLKQIASLRREVEAAGSKKKLLRDVNCISCDAKAVMSMEADAALPINKPLPANLSMKPYLTYELDAIRKTQASHLPQRNLHDWEQIDKQIPPKTPQKVRSETDKHLCNRYCGGSHTVTTPAQRVARLGHFVKQWGPDVLPLSSGVAFGDDGRMYKVSVPEASAGSGPEDPSTTKAMAKKSDPPKQAVVNPECRCLEENKGAT